MLNANSRLWFGCISDCIADEFCASSEVSSKNGKGESSTAAKKKTKSRSSPSENEVRLFLHLMKHNYELLLIYLGNYKTFPVQCGIKTVACVSEETSGGEGCNGSIHTLV